MSGEMSDVGEGTSLDSAVEAVGFAEEDGGRRVAIGHGGDVHAYTISHLIVHCKYNNALLHAYTIRRKISYCHQNKEISLLSGQNFGLVPV